VARTASSLDALIRGDFGAAGAHFSSRLEKKLDSAALNKVWMQMLAQAGDYREHATVTPQVLHGSKAVVIAPLTFARMKMDLVTACDDHDQLSAYQFWPVSTIQLLQSSPRTQPVKAHVDADGVRVTPMTVVSPAGALKGVLTLPSGKGPFPAVVMVAGSGANDFDETIGPNKPFRDIAQGLAKAGIASLRYDKRTLDYPEQWDDKGGNNVDSEVTEDALSAVHALAKVPQVDPHRVMVLGHSLGAMLAPRIGSRDSGLAGLIMMAAPARSFLDVMVQQFREQGQRAGLDHATIARKVAAFAAERKLLDTAKPGSAPDGKFMRMPQSYLLSLHNVHQVATAKSLSMPMLLLQGGADFQVSPQKDFARWKQELDGHKRVSFHGYPGLSHLFMEAGKTKTVADYTKPGHVKAKVINDIATWIKGQPARSL
jgi:dienelactone hydrolase